MDKIVVVGEIKDVNKEDGECAMIIPGLENETTEGADDCFFLRLQSWDETRVHATLNSLMGKKVKITVKVVE